MNRAHRLGFARLWAARWGLAAGLVSGLLGCEAIAGIEDRIFVEPDAAVPEVDASLGGEDAGGDAGPTRADSGAGDDAALDAGTGDGAEPAPCQTYCETVMANCTGDYAVYASEGLCLSLCAEFPAGDPSEEEPSGQSVACRLEQARLAGTTREPWDHCPRAGPGGAGRCGSNCESYCRLFESFCGESVEPDPDCVEKCGGLRDREDHRAEFDDSSFDVVRDYEGDTLQCRLVHLSSASQDPETHCWHAALAPRAMDDVVNPCADPADSAPRCEDYCRLNTTACSGEVAQYESLEQCSSVCEALTPGLNMDSGGQNTVGCRKTHSYNALVGGVSTHCPHSGPSGDGVCGDPCASYCQLVAAACPDAFASAFNDDEGCRSACEEIAKPETYSVAAGEAGGDTLWCRLLHAARAFEDAAQCESAIGMGSCQ